MGFGLVAINPGCPGDIFKIIFGAIINTQYFTLGWKLYQG